ACYIPKRSDNLIWGNCRDYGDRIAGLGPTMLGVWASTIISHPGVYLRHRLNFAAELLRRDGASNENIVSMLPTHVTGVNSPQFITVFPQNVRDGVQLWTPTISYVPFGTIAGLLIYGPLGHPLLSLSILSLAGVLAWVGRSSGSALAPMMLALFGIANFIEIAVFAASDDLRYLLPTWICALATVIWAVRHWRLLADHLPLTVS